MLKFILLTSSLAHAHLFSRPQCIELDVESTHFGDNLKVIDSGDLLVIQIKDKSKHILGRIKIGDLYENGNCNYSSRHIVIDKSSGKNKIKIVTDYSTGRSIIVEYIEIESGNYKVLSRKPFSLNFNDTLPEHVHKYYDEHHELHKIQVKNSHQELKIGNVTIGDHVIEDLSTSIERLIYFWDSEDGNRIVKVDTHLNDNRLLTDMFMEESPGSGKYLKKSKCGKNNSNPFGCWEHQLDIMYINNGIKHK